MNIKKTMIVISVLAWSSGIASANSNPVLIADKTASENAGSQKTVLKLFKMDCSSCAAEIESKLSSLKGISEATVDFDKEEAYVIYDPAKISVKQMIDEIRAIDFDAKTTDNNSFPKIGLKKLKETRDNQRQSVLKNIEAEDEKLGLKIVSNGEDIDLNTNLEPGKLTVFDFYADWCDHCIELGENLKTLMKKNPESFVVRKIHLKGDAKDTYKLPIVKKYLKGEYGFPYIRIYNSKGILLYEGGELNEIEQVLKNNSGKA